MWNWNRSDRHRVGSAFLTFNWTNVELKPASDKPDFKMNRLLIEPMWNWNVNFLLERQWQIESFNWTNVELKRLKEIWSSAHRATFNWTNVELKQHFGEPIKFSDEPLLIEPMWNWNTLGINSPFPPTPSFYWTNVELKHDNKEPEPIHVFF